MCCTKEICVEFIKKSASSQGSLLFLKLSHSSLNYYKMVSMLWPCFLKTKETSSLKVHKYHAFFELRNEEHIPWITKKSNLGFNNANCKVRTYLKSFILLISRSFNVFLNLISFWWLLSLKKPKFENQISYHVI